MYHTARMGETLAEALSSVGDPLLNVHLKDGRRKKRRLGAATPSPGEIPVKDALRLVKERGYKAFISVEWEKEWHPELAEPEVSFLQHIELLQTYVRELE